MFDVWNSIASLRQPCLMRAVPDAAIGDDGVVEDRLLRSIDEILWEEVEKGVLESRLPAFQIEQLYTADKWLTTSALQKCIRRGQRDLAERYARSGIRIDADHTFRRLAIIALEDLGLGNLKLIAATLAILGNKRRRRRIGEERLAAYLAMQMSSSIKSRLACDMLSLVEYDPKTTKTAEPLSKFDAAALSQIALNKEAGLTKQVISLWFLHGTARLRSQQLVSVVGAGWRRLLELLITQRAPLIFHYIVRMGISRCRDSLAIPYVVLAKFAERSPLVQTVRSDIPRPELIGAYPTFAYDMHTRIGRRAIKEFEVNCTDELRSAHVQDVGNLVFVLDGGVLDQRITGSEPSRIAQLATRLELFGQDRQCSNISDQRADLISKLDEIRRRVAVSA